MANARRRSPAAVFREAPPVAPPSLRPSLRDPIPEQDVPLTFEAARIGLVLTGVDSSGAECADPDAPCAFVEITDVAPGSPWDFYSRPKRVGQDIDAGDATARGGYDNAFVFVDARGGQDKQAAAGAAAGWAAGRAAAGSRPPRSRRPRAARAASRAAARAARATRASCTAWG